MYVQCYRWGVQAIITDITQVWLDLRKELQGMHALWLATCVSSLFFRGLQQGNRIRSTLPIPLPRVLQPSSNGYRYPPEEVSGEDRWSIREGLNRPGHRHRTCSCYCTHSSNPHRYSGLIVLVRSSSNKNSVFTPSIDEMTPSYFPFFLLVLHETDIPLYAWIVDTRILSVLLSNSSHVRESILARGHFEIILIIPGQWTFIPIHCASIVNFHSWVSSGSNSPARLSIQHTSLPAN